MAGTNQYRVSCAPTVDNPGTPHRRTAGLQDEEKGWTRLASKVLVGFPKVNLISILAGTLVIISLFLPWWGLDGSFQGFSASIRWSLWGQPYLGDPSSSTSIAQAGLTMGQFNITVLAVAFVSAAIAFLGSFAPKKEYLIAGFASSIVALLLYAGGISDTISIACKGSSTCIQGPVGSTVANGVIVNWGFETGFYLFLVGGVMMLFAVIFHQVFLERHEVSVQSRPPPGVRFCSSCGSSLEVDAKFCSHCAHAAPS